MDETCCTEKDTDPMPTATPLPKRNPIPAGDHLLCLVSVEEKYMPSFNDPKQETLRWVWQFKAKATDPETGDRYEYRVYTGPTYGDSRATLTILLDQICPDWTDEQKQNVNTDELLNTYYKAKIRHDKPDKLGDPPKPKFAFIEPYKKPAATAKSKTAPQPETTDDDEFLDDPFADQ
jgi:hypothetical protein